MKNTLLILIFLLLSVLGKNVYAQTSYDYVKWDFTQVMKNANYSSNINNQNSVKTIYFDNIDVSPIVPDNGLKLINGDFYHKTAGWNNNLQKVLTIIITSKNNYNLPNINTLSVIMHYSINNDICDNEKYKSNISEISKSIIIKITFLTKSTKDIVNIYDLTICGDMPLPINLKSFDYNQINNNIKLNWKTENEINNDKFEIYRNSIKVGEIKGNGTKNTISTYEFYDKNLQVGNYSYKLKQIDYNGNSEWFDLSTIIHINNPNKSNIEQNYPNPFNSSTRINYTVYKDNFIKIKIYDILGKEIKVLLNEYKQSGYYSINFDALKFSSGIYYYSFETDDMKIIKKMILIK